MEHTKTKPPTTHNRSTRPAKRYNNHCNAMNPSSNVASEATIALRLSIVNKPGAIASSAMPPTKRSSRFSPVLTGCKKLMLKVGMASSLYFAFCQILSAAVASNTVCIIPCSTASYGRLRRAITRSATSFTLGNWKVSKPAGPPQLKLGMKLRG